MIVTVSNGKPNAWCPFRGSLDRNAVKHRIHYIDTQRNLHNKLLDFHWMWLNLALTDRFNQLLFAESYLQSLGFVISCRELDCPYNVNNFNGCSGVLRTTNSQRYWFKLSYQVVPFYGFGMFYNFFLFTSTVVILIFLTLHSFGLIHS